MWGSYSNIPKAIFYLLKGDYPKKICLMSAVFRRGKGMGCLRVVQWSTEVAQAPQTVWEDPNLPMCIAMTPGDH